MRSIKSQSGSALVYILIAIALMGALTVTFMNSDGQQSRSQNAFKVTTQIVSQINSIRSAIEGCIIQFSRGDSTINDGSTTDDGYYVPYPLNPTSTHFGSPSADDTVGNLKCPGQNHTDIFGGSSGRFLPPTPSLFEDWVYFNGTKTVDDTDYTGVYILLATDKTDPYITEAFDKVDAQYAECEVDVVTGTNDDECAALGSSYNCLRYWLKRSEPTCP